MVISMCTESKFFVAQSCASSLLRKSHPCPKMVGVPKFGCAKVENGKVENACRCRLHLQFPKSQSDFSSYFSLGAKTNMGLPAQAARVESCLRDG